VSSETTSLAVDHLIQLVGGVDPAGTVIVTDRGVAASGSASTIADLFDPPPPIVSIAGGEPTVESVDAAATALHGISPKLVIAVGGGSVIDTSKVATALSGKELSSADVLEGRRVPERDMQLVAVPTTAGSGAEVTRTAVLSQSGRKTWAWGDPLRPNGACLIPAVTAGCPAPLTLASGLDAIVHAIEAGSSCRADHTDDRAREAFRRGFAAIRDVMSRPEGLDGRAEMQQAACLAGRAIDAHGTGAAHAVGHALSTVHGIPHGFAVGLSLAATLEWSIAGAADRYSELAGAVGLAVPDLPSAIGALLGELRFVELAAPFMPAAIDAAELATVLGAPENAPMRANNARPIEEADHRPVADMTARAWDSLRAAS
jgi:alcohol dehydrogenase class IV